MKSQLFLPKEKYKDKELPPLSKLTAIIAKTLYHNVDWSTIRIIKIDSITYIYNHLEETLKPI